MEYASYTNRDQGQVYVPGTGVFKVPEETSVWVSAKVEEEKRAK